MMEDWVADFCNWNNDSPVKPAANKKQSRRRSLRILRRQSVDRTALETARNPIVHGDHNEEIQSVTSIDANIYQYTESPRKNEPKGPGSDYGTVWLELAEGNEDIEKPAKKRRQSVCRQSVSSNRSRVKREDPIQYDKENLEEFKSAESRLNDEVERLWSELDSISLISADSTKTGKKTKPKRRQSFYQKERRRSRVLQPIKNCVYSGMSNSPFVPSPLMKLKAVNSSDNGSENMENASSAIHSLDPEILISKTGSYLYSQNAVCVVENVFQFTGDPKSNSDASDSDDMSKVKDHCIDANTYGHSSDEGGQRLVNIVDLGANLNYNAENTSSDHKAESMTDLKGSLVGNRTAISPSVANSNVSGTEHGFVDICERGSEATYSSIVKGFAGRLHRTSDSPEICRSATPESGTSKMQYFMNIVDRVDKKGCRKESDLQLEAPFCDSTPETSFSNKSSFSKHFVETVAQMNKTADLSAFDDVKSCTPDVIDSHLKIYSVSTTPIITTPGGENMDTSTFEVSPKSIEIPCCSTAPVTGYGSPSSESSSSSSTPKSFLATNNLEGGSPSLPSRSNNFISCLDSYFSKNFEIDSSPDKCEWIDVSDIPLHIIGGKPTQSTSGPEQSSPVISIPEADSSLSGRGVCMESTIQDKTLDEPDGEGILIVTDDNCFPGQIHEESPNNDKIIVDYADKSIIVIDASSERIELDCGAKIEQNKLFDSENALQETVMKPALEDLLNTNIDRVPSLELPLLANPIKAETESRKTPPKLHPQEIPLPTEPMAMEVEVKKTTTKPLKPKKSRKRKLEDSSVENSAGGDGFTEIPTKSVKDEEDRLSQRSTRLRRKSVEIYRTQTRLLESYDSDSPVVSADDLDSPNFTERGPSRKRKTRVKKKKKENVEDIYLNKLYKKPTDKVFSTIFEDPNSDQVFSQRRQRRSITFDTYTVQPSKTKKRTQKATKLGWGPAVRKKHAISQAEFEKKIQALEADLDDFLTE